jgi:hypothetical protein
VVVAVAAVGVVQVPVHEVVDVIAVRHRRMPTVGTVNVIACMACALVGVTGGRVCVRDSNHVFVIVIFVGAVQVAIVQVTNMVAVLDSHMAAVRSVLMLMVVVNLMSHGWVFLVRVVYG